jgi:hypothetical protein
MTLLMPLSSTPRDSKERAIPIRALLHGRKVLIVNKITESSRREMDAGDDLSR